MYRDEKVIDGVLHWRGTPRGEWRPYSAARLTEILLRERAASIKLQLDTESTT